MRRPLLPGDISAAARALLAVPAEDRRTLCCRIFRGAAEALAHGALHPRWGDGSLSAAARAWRLADEPFLDDPEYLACTRLVLRQAAAVLARGGGGAPAR